MILSSWLNFAGKNQHSKVKWLAQGHTQAAGLKCKHRFVFPPKSIFLPHYQLHSIYVSNHSTQDVSFLRDPHPIEFHWQEHLIHSLQGYWVYKVKILVIVIKRQMASHSQTFPESCSIPSYWMIYKGNGNTDPSLHSDWGSTKTASWRKCFLM